MSSARTSGADDWRIYANDRVVAVADVLAEDLGGAGGNAAIAAALRRKYGLDLVSGQISRVLGQMEDAGLVTVDHFQTGERRGRSLVYVLDPKRHEALLAEWVRRTVSQPLLRKALFGYLNDSK